MKIYKDSNNLIWFGETVYPIGYLGLSISGTSIAIWEAFPKNTIFTGDVTTLTNESNVAYATVADFLAAVGDFFVSATQLLEARVAELENKQTLFIDYWQDNEPVAPSEGDIWFDSNDEVLSVYNNNIWTLIPLSSDSIYVNRNDNVSYAWTGSAMVNTSAPLTKASIEALLTGEITSHSHYNAAPRTSALATYAIDVSSAEIFTKTLGSNSQFTITNPVLNKFFKLVITGGTLNADLFSGYTETWILNSLVTDYVPASSNILVCEIRSAGTIHLFWSE